MHRAQNAGFGAMEANVPHHGGNRLSGRELVGAAHLNASSASVGRAFGAPGAVPFNALPSALGPADPSNCNVLFDGWQGLGGKPAPLPASPMSYGAAYAPSEQCEPTVVNLA